MIDKAFILGEIQRSAQGGRALGQNRFCKETGIKLHEWRGRYWARWGDAVIEAGLLPDTWQSALDEEYILKTLLGTTRSLRRLPTNSEILLQRRSDSSYPSPKAIRRLGKRDELKAKLLSYSSEHEAYADLTEIISLTHTEEISEKAEKFEGVRHTSGYVYIIKAQSCHKIGSTGAPYRRAAEIANQSASGAELIHCIRTDDPEGIEAYWHRRFASKRLNGVNKQSGEWFALSNDDLRAFSLRKWT